MIIKTKLKCKGTCQTIDWYGAEHIHKTDRFVEGKWYDVEYETWESKYTSEEDMCRINNGWRKYWAIDELGHKSELSKAEINIIFNTKIDEIRNDKIDDILD